MTKEGDTRPNVVYIVVDSIAGVQYRPGLYNSFLTRTPGSEGVHNTALKYCWETPESCTGVHNSRNKHLKWAFLFCKSSPRVQDSISVLDTHRPPALGKPVG